VPPCRVDSTTCTKYSGLVAKLLSKHNELQADLELTYRNIAADYRSIGDCVPRLKDPKISGKIWKYRVKHSTENRGKSYGFRLIGYLNDGVMYLLFIYPKTDQDDMTRDEYRKLVKNLEADLSALSPTAPEPPSELPPYASPPTAS
jgi:hypothetical protein